MAVVALVLDKDLGENKEGDIIHVEEEQANQLVEGGFAHVASEDEVNQPEEENPEEGADDAVASPAADDVLNLGKSAPAVDAKAAEQIVAQAVKQIKKAARVNRPAVKVEKRGSWSVPNTDK